MISNTISRAACLAELTSNPKSFYNCPDLHGGPGLPEGAKERSGKSEGQRAWSMEIGKQKLKTEMLKAERVSC